MRLFLWPFLFLLTLLLLLLALRQCRKSLRNLAEQCLISAGEA